MTTVGYQIAPAGQLRQAETAIFRDDYRGIQQVEGMPSLGRDGRAYRRLAGVGIASHGFGGLTGKAETRLFRLVFDLVMAGVGVVPGVPDNPLDIA